MLDPKSPLDPHISLPLPNSSISVNEGFSGLVGRCSGSALCSPVFVVGCPRSGTTVLGSCLAAHPELGGGKESLFFLDCWRILNDLHVGNNPQGSTPLRDYVSSQQLIEIIGNFTDSLVTGLLLKTGKPRFVDHTPWYVACIPFLRLLYPDCKIVHVVRDGRHVVASLQISFSKGRSWAGKSIEESAQLWTSLVTSGFDNGRLLPRENYIEVRYEDLLCAPEEFLKSLLEALDLPWNNQVLLPLAKPHATPSTPFKPLSEMLTDGSIRPLKRTPAPNWPPTWSMKEREDFKKISGAAMARSGYMINDA